MIAFVTSSPFREDVDRPMFSNVNGFVDRIKACLMPEPSCLFICADPQDHAFTCRIGADLFIAFAHIGVHFSAFHVLDGCNAHLAEELVRQSDLIVLAGGHLPTQNAFFQSIGLHQLLQHYPGVVMGISAGAMNCADTVYCQPEEPGESSPDFPRFLPGLGLTTVQILPHYQKVKDYIIDGKRLYEDVTFADSMGHTFYALPDWSYVVVEGERQTLYGAAFRIRDGQMLPLTKHGECVRLY
ncbi:MAG: Type 1 glutamine amidotransferase-like domain-containing protein [Oscillospiraceae bacterium]|nr:Type 1 glutamine amidotransferase-like domain-containing protein [Oscillospiraceae bacterium]